MARPVNSSMIRAIASRAFAEDARTRLIAVSAAPVWEGPALVDTDGGAVQVRPCVSALAVREVLAEVLADPGNRAVILTELDEETLGTEVLARLWRHRVVRPSGWDALKDLFRVTDVDPALADHRWLVDLLVEVAPARGYAPPKSGLLDLDTAWQTFFRHGLRIDAERPALTDLLAWGDREGAQLLLSGTVQNHTDRVAERIGGSQGAVARLLFRLVAQGRGADLVPLGLVCDVLWSTDLPETQQLTTARVRIEGPVGARGITESMARAWGRAAAFLVHRAFKLSNDPDRLRWVNRAEAILGGELDAFALAHASDVLPRSFEQRLEDAGRALLEAIREPAEITETAARQTVERASRHLRALGGAERDRVERLRMSERLVRRWGGHSEAEATSDLADAARSFLKDGAWVDRAREALSHGETVESLTQAYHAILQRLDTERTARDRRFAGLLAPWSAVAPGTRPPLLPIERVLDEVVVPIAKQAPVLLIVLDGWSLPLAGPLIEDLGNIGWQRHGPADTEHPIVVSALPSITTVSRASLLSGCLVQGGQDVERAGWKEHEGLRAASGNKSPRLFHRADLVAVEGETAREVRAAVLDTAEQVVGVVINAIDENLDKGGQLRLAEGFQALRPLGPLLDAAMEAGRVVILASDHGHVLESGSRTVTNAGAGERWRPVHPPADPQADEILLKGPRVLLENGAIVVPCTEHVRYISTKKYGYHGGATPQEVICPLVVLAAPGVSVSGWAPLPALEPWWWRPEGRLVEDGLGPSVSPSVEETTPTVDSRGQVQLFADQARSTTEATREDEAWLGPAWLTELLASPILASQRMAAGRQSLADDDVATLLLALDGAGGVVRVNVLADHLQLPVNRIQTKASVLRRLVNIDGFSVVEIEGDGTIRFDRDLLIRQFGLSP